jgi:exoribonuclease R
MFPAELSTGLQPESGVDRLRPSCLMEVDRRGGVVDTSCTTA